MGTLRSLKMTCIAIALCLTAISVSAQTLTTLTRFTGGNGKTPLGALVQGKDGNFYGTTFSGGANSNGGTVFKITPQGAVTTLYNFCSQTDCSDGESPAAALLLGKNGNFYGSTLYGGANCVSSSQPSGCGTIFEITPEGTLTTIHSFCGTVNSGYCADGTNPNSPLVQGANGNFYGTTVYGGGNNYDIGCFCNGGGTVFEISPAGKLKTLYNFCNVTNSNGYCLDGGAPMGVLQTSDGNLYGMTYDGGTGLDNSGGTVFELTTTHKLITLHNFCSQSTSTQFCTDGAYPHSGLIQASDGNFYGVTTGGGYDTWGTILKITPAGKLTTLHRFKANEGTAPNATLLQASDGNLYGTTTTGGIYSDKGNASGTVFRITLGGQFNNLYNFCSLVGCTDGQFPSAGLVQGSNGDLYGVTSWGGSVDDGTVFSLTLQSGSSKY